MPTPDKARAVVFDLDDTLFPERMYVRSGYRAVAAAVAPRPDAPPAETLEHWLWQRFLRGEAAGAFDALSAEFRLDLSQADVAGLVEAYRTHRPGLHPYPGMPALLGKLHGRYRLGLLSDGYLPAQQLKLDAVGLERFFDEVVFTEALGRDCWKPSPAGFEAARERLDVPHTACAYVADNPAKDFVAGNRLGWRTIRFRRPGQVHAANPPAAGGEPRFVARDPGEIYEALLAAV